MGYQRYSRPFSRASAGLCWNAITDTCDTLVHYSPYPEISPILLDQSTYLTHNPFRPFFLTCTTTIPPFLHFPYNEKRPDVLKRTSSYITLSSNCFCALFPTFVATPLAASVYNYRLAAANVAAMFDNLSKRETVGVTGALPYDPIQYCILAAGTAIAWAYTIELDLVIFYTFRRRKGLYFWSLLISSWGCTLHALGFILKFLVGTTWLVDLPFIEVGRANNMDPMGRTAPTDQRVRMGCNGYRASLCALLSPSPGRPQPTNASNRALDDHS